MVAVVLGRGLHGAGAAGSSSGRSHLCGGEDEDDETYPDQSGRGPEGTQSMAAQHVRPQAGHAAQHNPFQPFDRSHKQGMPNFRSGETTGRPKDPSVDTDRWGMSP